MGGVESRVGKVLREAEFDPKLKLYWLISGSIVFIVTIVGIPFLPFWLLFGPAYCGRKFRSLEAVLTEKVASGGPSSGTEAGGSGSGSATVLEEIRDTLLRIEERLKPLP